MFYLQPAHKIIINCRSILVTQDAAVPSISMPNQSKNRNAFDNAEEDVKSANKINSEKQVVSKKEKAPTTGWFGGIWNKFALRPKNQMKLPDDKNPTVSKT